MISGVAAKSVSEMARTEPTEPSPSATYASPTLSAMSARALPGLSPNLRKASRSVTAMMTAPTISADSKARLGMSNAFPARVPTPVIQA